MNIKKLKEIINSPFSDETKEIEIIYELAKDKKILPTLILLINAEREQNKELLLDMNLLLSKAHLGLDEPEINAENFMQKEIIEFYKKYKGIIGHCFKDLKF